jgi:hypothetical protein
MKDKEYKQRLGFLVTLSLPNKIEVFVLFSFRARRSLTICPRSNFPILEATSSSAEFVVVTQRLLGDLGEERDMMEWRWRLRKAKRLEQSSHTSSPQTQS